MCVLCVLCSEFLEHGASNEVNVSAKVQEEVGRDLKLPSRYSFTAAQVRHTHTQHTHSYDNVYDTGANLPANAK